MAPWLWSAPSVVVDEATEAAFTAAFAGRDASRLPAGVPRWVFLEWLVRRGWLLHGSNEAGITRFEPRAPYDASVDDFSKRTAVFASSDGVWALMYALRDRARVRGMLNAAMQLWEGERWSGMRYFLSLAPREGGVTDGRALLRAGSVYVLPAGGFERMPPYAWPGVGEVLEPHWANPEPVRPVWCVRVSAVDFPLPPRSHDADRVARLSRRDPWGFPWLDADDAPVQEA